jgi:hypothetical protein
MDFPGAAVHAGGFLLVAFLLSNPARIATRPCSGSRHVC